MRGVLYHVFHPSRTELPVALAFAASFVDVICVLGLFNTFTAAITGSIVVLGADLFTNFADAVPKLTVLVTFVASSAVWYAVVSRQEAAGTFSLRAVFLIEAALLTIFLVVAVSAAPLPGPLEWTTIVCVVVSTIAMALQNVVMIVVLAGHAATTMMTGNWMRLVAAWIDGGRARQADPEKAATLHRRAIHHGEVMIAFAIGGIAGGFAMTVIGFWALVVPITLLGLLALAQPGKMRDPAG